MRRAVLWLEAECAAKDCVVYTSLRDSGIRGLDVIVV
jgi:hypothetical protein